MVFVLLSSSKQLTLTCVTMCVRDSCECATNFTVACGQSLFPCNCFFILSLFFVVVFGCAVRLFVCLSAGWLWKQKQTHTTTPAGITLIQVQLAIYPNRCMIYPVCIHYLRADRLTKPAYAKQMFDVVSLPVFHPYPPTHTHTYTLPHLSDIPDYK